jgi:hypothetical protein
MRMPIVDPAKLVATRSVTHRLPACNGDVACSPLLRCNAVEMARRRATAIVSGGRRAYLLAGTRFNSNHQTARRGMAAFTVQQGKRYRATITLGGIERWASNEMIAGKLREAGFSEVVVSGVGNTRTAEAVWSGADTTGEMPAQVTDIVQV